MKIEIHGKNIELSNRLEDYSEEKVEKLSRYLPNIINAHLEIRREKRNGKELPIAQLTVRNNRGVVLRAEDRSQTDPFASVDVVVDKLYRQIRRYKTKTRRKGGEKWVEAEPAWEAVEEVPIADDVEDYDSLDTQQVLRRKSVLLTPMSEQEAIDQMELLGHDFFLFYNGEEDTINVMYRRKDGTLGILTPQIT